MQSMKISEQEEMQLDKPFNHWQNNGLRRPKESWLMTGDVIHNAWEKLNGIELTQLSSPKEVYVDVHHQFNQDNHKKNSKLLTGPPLISIPSQWLTG